MKRLLMTLVSASLLLTAAPASAADKLTVILDWFVNPDHGPLFVALERGEFAKRGLEVELIAPADPNDPPKLVAAGRADSHGVSAGFNPIRKHPMSAAAQTINTLHFYGRRSRPFDLGAHCDKAFGEVGDLRFARRIFNSSFALGENSGQHRVLCRSDRNKRQHYFRAMQPVRALGDYIAFIKIDSSAHSA